MRISFGTLLVSVMVVMADRRDANAFMLDGGGVHVLC